MGTSRQARRRQPAQGASSQAAAMSCYAPDTGAVTTRQDGVEIEMSDPQVLSFRPDAEQFAWTFGGAAPVARIKPGTVLELWTEDCFAGRVRGTSDLVSEVCEFPFLNPQ